jgi:outer membrane lipoprotein-sorting protein
MMRVHVSRRARWAVPATAVVATAGVIAGLQIPAAQASPALPARTPAQLLAALATDAKLPPLTGTVVESTSLGLPQLPTAGSPTSIASLITGSHTVNVYYQDASHFRLSVPTTDSETDIIADGSKGWLWNSTANSVTEFLAPAGRHAAPKMPQVPALTPQQAASQVLKAVGKTTLVSVESNVMVAGDPAYQLVLAPKDHRSLIGKIKIAVDAKYGMPLRVEVFAKKASAPSFQVGYTVLQFTAPAPGNFTFTPPAGATVKVVHLGTGTKPAPGHHAQPSGFGTYGTGWLSVAEFPQKDLMQGLGTGPAVSGPASSGSSGPASVMGGDSQQVLSALVGSAKPASGAWGSGTLLTTSLFSVLMTNGEVYVGAVEPSVLEAAVGHTSS